MRWHCAVGEAGEGQVRRGKRCGRWVGNNGGARRDLNRNERRGRRAENGGVGGVECTSTWVDLQCWDPKNLIRG